MLVVFFSFFAGAEAQARHRTRPAAPPPVERSEKYAALVIEADTGRILFERNGAASRYPASLTKMMTLYLAFQAIENGSVRLDSLMPVSQNAAQQSPTKLGLRAGSRIQMEDAVLGLVTLSANDAAIVLAEALGGDVPNFVRMMNKQARDLGMRHTVFQNPNGLPDGGQVSCARDMAILGYALIYHFPGFYPYFERKNFSYAGRSYHNHNNLMLRYKGMDGIKTGYTNASGFNLVSSAVQEDRRIIGVVFGGQTAARRDQHMAGLLDNGFDLLRQTASISASYDYLPLPSKTAAAFPSRPAPTGRAQAPVAPPQPVSTPLSPPQKFGEEPQPALAGSWGIQVGAFNESTAARELLTKIAVALGPVLRGSEQSLQKLTMTDGSTIYRARFMGLEQHVARAACGYIIKHGQGCLVVSGP